MKQHVHQIVWVVANPSAEYLDSATKTRRDRVEIHIACKVRNCTFTRMPTPREMAGFAAGVEHGIELAKEQPEVLTNRLEYAIIAVPNENKGE